MIENYNSPGAVPAVVCIDGVDGYEKDGTVYLRLENVARGLGFTTVAASGNEVVRWNTLYNYLTDLGAVAGSCNGGYRDACPEFVAEYYVYRLAMKAKNEAAEAFQDKLARDVIPSIRRTGGYHAKPMTTAEMLLMQAQLNVDMEKRLSRVEDMQQRQAAQVQEVVGIFALPTVQREQWCEQMNRRIAAICERDGCPHQKFRGDTYRELEDAARVDLDSRLTRKKKRLKDAGEKAVVYRNITKLQIIGEDDKLRPIYEGIIRKHDAQSLSRRFPS